MEVWIWKISHSKYLHVRLINFIRVSFCDLRNLHLVQVAGFRATVILKFHRFRIAIF